MKLTGGSGKKKAEKTAEKKTTAPKQETKKAPAAAKPKKKSAGMTPAKITILVVAIVVAVLAAAAAGGVYYVSTIEEIYPNVSLDGHALGGMSATEAAAELDGLGYSSQEGEEVNVHLPLEVSLNVKASEVCSETPISDLVQRVYEATAGGNPFEDAISYIKCRFGGMALESEILITVDREAVAAKVDGTTDLKYLFKVMLPICRPTVVTIAILKIIECWNSYVWPRLITDEEAYFLVSNGIQAIRENGFGRENIPAMMAAVVVISLPLIVLFLIFRKKIMEGVARGGLKG